MGRFRDIGALAGIAGGLATLLVVPNIIGNQKGNERIELENNFRRHAIEAEGHLGPGYPSHESVHSYLDGLRLSCPVPHFGGEEYLEEPIKTLQVEFRNHDYDIVRGTRAELFVEVNNRYPGYSAGIVSLDTLENYCLGERAIRNGNVILGDVSE